MAHRQRRAPAARPKREKMLDVLSQFRIVINSVRSHYRAVERRAGVSGAQLWALAEVAREPGTQVGRLARRLAIHQSTASNLLTSLERQGLVTRERGADQRSVEIYPTRKGTRLLGKAPQPPIGVLQQALSELPAANLRRLNRELTGLIELMHVKSVDARGTPLSEM